MHREHFDPAKSEREQQTLAADPAQEARHFTKWMTDQKGFQEELNRQIDQALIIKHAAGRDIDIYRNTDPDIEKGRDIAKLTIHTFFLMLWADTQKTNPDEIRKTIQKLRATLNGWRFDLSESHWMEVVLPESVVIP